MRFNLDRDLLKHNPQISNPETYPLLLPFKYTQGSSCALFFSRSFVVAKDVTEMLFECP